MVNFQILEVERVEIYGREGKISQTFPDFVVLEIIDFETINIHCRLDGWKYEEIQTIYGKMEYAGAFGRIVFHLQMLELILDNGIRVKIWKEE